MRPISPEEVSGWAGEISGGIGKVSVTGPLNLHIYRLSYVRRVSIGDRSAGRDLHLCPL